MKSLVVSLAVLIVGSTILGAQAPTQVQMKSTTVAIPARVMDQELELPGILHQPLGRGPYPAVVM